MPLRLQTEGIGVDFQHDIFVYHDISYSNYASRLLYSNRIFRFNAGNAKIGFIGQV